MTGERHPRCLAPPLARVTHWGQDGTVPAFLEFQRLPGSDLSWRRKGVRGVCQLLSRAHCAHLSLHPCTNTAGCDGGGTGVPCLSQHLAVLLNGFIFECFCILSHDPISHTGFLPQSSFIVPIVRTSELKIQPNGNFYKQLNSAWIIEKCDSAASAFHQTYFHV